MEGLVDLVGVVGIDLGSYALYAIVLIIILYAPSIVWANE